jgi:hypothetical protein
VIFRDGEEAKKRLRTGMIKRTTTRTITFAHPFVLDGIDEVQPAGSYTVETDEELIQTLSFPAYRSTGTWVRLPAQGRVAALQQSVSLTPAELDEALAKDAHVTLTIVGAPTPAELSADRVGLPRAHKANSAMDALKAELARLLARLAPKFGR